MDSNSKVATYPSGHRYVDTI